MFTSATSFLHSGSEFGLGVLEGSGEPAERLVRTLAAQLDASIELKSESGTEVRLVFPQTEKAS